jgi:hypothetical protein
LTAAALYDCYIPSQPTVLCAHSPLHLWVRYRQVCISPAHDFGSVHAGRWEWHPSRLNVDSSNTCARCFHRHIFRFMRSAFEPRIHARLAGAIGHACHHRDGVQVRPACLCERSAAVRLVTSACVRLVCVTVTPSN